MKRFKYYTPILMQKLGYIVFWPLHRLFVRLEIRGRENLANIKGPIIIAANHTSELDTTAIHMILPFFSKFSPLYYLTNATEKYKTFGWRSYFYGEVFFNIFGGYAIHSGHKNYGWSLDSHIKLLRRGQTITIYPEGMITLDGQMNPARGGLGYMVYITGATVVPVAIDTFFNLSWSEYFSRKRKVVMTILPAMHHEKVIDVTNPGVEDFRAAGQKVLDKIRATLRD